jgi:hypothetical protein
MTYEVKTGILRSFMTARKAVNDLVFNDKFFSSAVYGNLKPHLWRFAISSQLLKITLDPAIPLVSEHIVVNNYKLQAVVLESENAKLTIYKTAKDETLPRPSLYMRRFASNNSVANRQLTLRPEITDVLEPPYYGIITYSLGLDDFKHISIIMPDRGMKKICTHIPLYGSSFMMRTDESYDEKQLASLKEDIITKYSDKQG